MNKSISYLFIFLFCLSQLNAQGGSVGCGEVIVDQIPFTFDSTTVGGENNVNVSNQGAGDGDDIVFTLNVHDTITIDISLCHSETLYDAQMGVYILDETCTIDTILPTCRYPLEPLGGAQVDCFAEDTWACTYASAAVPDSADIGVDQAHYRPIIYEYELFPYEGQDTTAYYIVVDGWNGVTGNFRITIEYSQAPYIVSTELHEENDWIDLTLNESVFSNEFPWDNQAPIDLGDLTIDFNQNDGYVTEVVIDEITKTNGNPLEGGELTVRVHLNVFNEPPVAGSETIEIGPINSSTLYDGGGTSMQDTSTSGVDTLNQSQCFDQELTEADFPFNRVTDLSITSNNWDFLSFPGIPDDPDFLDPNIGNQGGINQRNGNDYAYKLTLTEPRTIYVTTCDDSTTLDVQIAIFNDCDMSTWIFYQDDSHWYIVYPDGTWEEYQFQCISGLIQLPTIANMLPRIELEAGDYYVVVDDRQTLIQGSTVGTWIGYSLLVDSTNISESLNSIDYYFNQEVYGGDYPDVYAGNGIGLEISDFEITIEPNGGNATLAEFTSITNLLDNPLSGGEEAIRLNIDYNEPPSGSEVVIIKPASVHSVFNVIGVPLLDTTGIEINLVDQVPPSLSFNPDVGDTISPTANIEIIFSERVYLIGGINPDDADIGGFFDLSYGGSNPESIDFDATINNNDSIVIINPTTSLIERSTVLLTVNANVLQDEIGNLVNQTNASFHVDDTTAPVINWELCSISTSNAFIILSFSEGVYTDINGSGGLDVWDFTLDFFDNNGHATAAEILGLQRPGSSVTLEGDEDSIWVSLNVTGPPDGNETIIIQPIEDAIYDSYNNSLIQDPIPTPITLNKEPWLDTYSLDDDNGYVDLIFSEDVYSASDCSSAVEPADFDIILYSNEGGHAIDAAITSLSTINDILLSGGEDTIRATILLSNPPASGVETIVIRPIDAYSICNSLGNRLSLSDGTVELTLIDRLAPTITAVSIIDPTVVGESLHGDIEFIASEGMFNNPFGGGAIDKTDFNLAFYQNNGNATDVSIDTVIAINPGDLTVGQDTVLISFETERLPSGTEEFAIIPASSSSIFDENGNPMSHTTVSERLLLPDKLPPEIIAGSSSISSGNSYVIFTLTEGVYGVSEITAPVEPEDFTVEFIQNGGNAIGAAVNYITNYRQFPLIGGEDILRCYLTIQGTPSGHERLYIRATDDYSVFDLNDNGMDISQVTDTLQLYDQLVPTVDSVSIPHGSPIGSAVESPINITFSEPIQSFGYSVSARHYRYLTYSTDTTATSFKVTLQPPMASLDTITLSIFNLTDNSGLEAVDFSYEFYTPPLGDYEPYDGKVNVLDLAQFVSFWMADSQPAILGLGPTSGTFPHLVPLLDEEYNLDDGMTFIRMWSWSLDRFGLEPLTSPTIGIAMNWDKLVVDIPMEAIAGQVYLRYNPLQGKVDLNHTAFGNNNLTLKREAVENGEILLEFGLVEPDDNARVISIKPEINEPAEATVIYKFFAADQSLIAAGTQKIALVIPTEFRLIQNYPNPFNNTTTIRYAVPEETLVQLEIFDIKGRLVETLTSQSHQPGFYALQWSGRRAASGVYFIKLEADKTVLTQKMILLK